MRFIEAQDASSSRVGQIDADAPAVQHLAIEASDRGFSFARSRVPFYTSRVFGESTSETSHRLSG